MLVPIALKLIMKEQQRYEASLGLGEKKKQAECRCKSVSKSQQTSERTSNSCSKRSCSSEPRCAEDPPAEPKTSGNGKSSHKD
eukprot:7463989-Karenia_brevis.AAC.1